MRGSVGEEESIALVLRSREGVGRGLGGSEAQAFGEAPACCGAMAGCPSGGSRRAPACCEAIANRGPILAGGAAKIGGEADAVAKLVS